MTDKEQDEFTIQSLLKEIVDLQSEIKTLNMLLQSKDLLIEGLEYKIKELAK